MFSTLLAVGSMGTETVTDSRYVVRVPESLNDAEAATLPLAHLTAHHALIDLASVKPGERVLVHAAAGGVGMAAVRLARHLGAEVFATASPAKWPLLHAAGIPAERVASSRTPAFADRFGQVDVVLNALTGDLLDASLDLLGQGGRFLEMGKTDLRDTNAVEAERPGVRYRAFDLVADNTPDDILRMLEELVRLHQTGAVRPLPFIAHDLREAPTVLRTMSGGGHIGKLVLTVPRPLDPEGTVLITGGTGDLGRRCAEHLVRSEGVRHLVLASRCGPAAEGTDDLVATLTSAGAASVRVVACDVADRAAVRELLVNLSRPLTGVFHLAGVLDDGLLANQDAARVGPVLGSKADAALVIHEETLGTDLRAFVLWSSLSGQLGGAGQATYAAANAVLDALAVHRARRGRPGTSLAWGPLRQATAGMTSHLTASDRARMARQGLVALQPREADAVLAAARRFGTAQLLPVRLDRRVLEPSASPLFTGLGTVPPQRPAAVDATAFPTADWLRALGGEGRHTALVELVRREVAGVLGTGGPASVDPRTSMRSVGLDSLMALELRNRLAHETGLALPTTIAFDAPTPEEMAKAISQLLGVPSGPPPIVAGPHEPPGDPVAAARWALDRLPAEVLDGSEVLRQLLALVEAARHEPVQEQPDLTDDEIDRVLAEAPSP